MKSNTQMFFFTLLREGEILRLLPILLLKNCETPPWLPLRGTLPSLGTAIHECWEGDGNDHESQSDKEMALSYISMIFLHYQGGWMTAAVELVVEVCSRVEISNCEKICSEIACPVRAEKSVTRQFLLLCWTYWKIFSHFRHQRTMKTSEVEPSVYEPWELTN